MPVTTPVRVFRSTKKHEGVVASGAPDRSYEAFEILYVTFIALPIIAGAAKYFNFLADWQRDLPPLLSFFLGRTALTILKGVGILEIALGLLVAANPRVGAQCVTAWLWLGALYLLLFSSNHHGLAVCLLTLSSGAMALSLLAEEFNGR